jgi:membrane protease YdiL (CAAX protease family)
LLGSLLIVLIARRIWPADWKDWLGLSMRRRDALLAAALAPILMALLYFTVQAIIAEQELTYLSPLAGYGLLSLVYLHTLGQTLNEEMLLGALLLNASRRKFDHARPLWIVATIALLFALLHYIFYRWIVIPEYGGILTASALFVLFALGVLRNTLIVKTGHIAYSWSVHFSLNAVGLIGVYTFANGEELLEPQVINLILGSRAAVVLSVIVFASCIAVLLSARPGAPRQFQAAAQRSRIQPTDNEQEATAENQDNLSVTEHA